MWGQTTNNLLLHQSETLKKYIMKMSSGYLCNKPPFDDAVVGTIEKHHKKVAQR